MKEKRMQAGKGASKKWIKETGVKKGRGGMRVGGKKSEGMIER